MNLIDIIQTIGIISTLLFAIWQVRFQIKSNKVSHYGELDALYGELLKLAIEKPYLRNLQAKRTPEQQLEYEYYAHLVWCFVETVYDRASPEDDLMRIWRTAIEVENTLHREWFDRPENECMFRSEFRGYINKNFNKPQLERVKRI